MIRHQQAAGTVMLILVGEVTQLLNGVVTDRIQTIACGLELRQYSLQLDELRHARRSPIGRSMEYDDRLAASSRDLQIGLTSRTDLDKRKIR